MAVWITIMVLVALVIGGYVGSMISQNVEVSGNAVNAFETPLAPDQKKKKLSRSRSKSRSKSRSSKKKKRKSKKRRKSKSKSRERRRKAKALQEVQPTTNSAGNEHIGGQPVQPQEVLQPQMNVQPQQMQPPTAPSR